MLNFNGLGRQALGRWDTGSAVPEPPTPDTLVYKSTFSSLTNSALYDWETENFNSYLHTYYIVPEDAMSWMQSPYIYTFLSTEEQNVVINSADEVVIDSDGTIVVNEGASLLMNAVWDWSNTNEGENVVDSSFTQVVDSTGAFVIDDLTSPKASRDIQVYRFRDGYSVAVAKNKIRGRGKVLQLRFNSFGNIPFNLLGWAAWIGKNTKP